MTIQLNPSFARSLAIANLLLASERLRNDIVQSGFIDAYQNGREQGICIWGYDTHNNTTYFITGHHPTTEGKIRIYKGKFTWLMMPEEVLDTYMSPNFFDTIEEAVEWLIKELLSYSEE